MEAEDEMTTRKTVGQPCVATSEMHVERNNDSPIMKRLGRPKGNSLEQVHDAFR